MDSPNVVAPLTNRTVESPNSCRPLAQFHSNVWGNRFLENTTAEPNQPNSTLEALEELKKELMEVEKIPSQQLQLIDAIQRLGIEYYFEEEIDQILKKIFDNHAEIFKCNSDLYTTALCFRLLRQHGHQVSSDIFDKFKDAISVLHTSTSGDNILALYELYEAAHLNIRGEAVLDDILSFTKIQLHSTLLNISGPVAEEVDQALNNFCLRRGLTRLGARRYINLYEQRTSHHESLLKLAKLDFNWLQAMHKTELREIYSWWTALDILTKLPYARDRMVECYFWILGVYFEPQYSLGRKFLSRVIAVASMIDDTYDAYATFEELHIFAQAIERWDVSCLDELPQYMKFLYTILLELFREIEQEMIQQERSYRFAYAKEAMKDLARSYYEEAKWRNDKYIPTMEEYMPVATRSCGYTMLIIVSFLGIGDIATREAFEWVLGQPDIVKASLIICRLTGDIAAHEFERKRDHIPSAVECYMKQYNVSKQDAIDVFKNDIETAWKDINQGFMRPTEIPVPLLYRILNFVRVLEVTHKKGDYYTHVGPEMQSYVKQLLIDPVPI